MLIKSVIVVVIACICLYLALVFMPWSELQMGLDMNGIPDWSKPLIESPLMKPLTDLGQQSMVYLKKGGAESHFGDYMYGLVIGIILTAIGFVYMVVGREEAEEKLYLPIKK